jgi:hypothetical protein
VLFADVLHCLLSGKRNERNARGKVTRGAEGVPADIDLSLLLSFTS